MEDFINSAIDATQNAFNNYGYIIAVGGFLLLLCIVALVIVIVAPKRISKDYTDALNDSDLDPASAAEGTVSEEVSSVTQVDSSDDTPHTSDGIQENLSDAVDDLCDSLGENPETQHTLGATHETVPASMFADSPTTDEAPIAPVEDSTTAVEDSTTADEGAADAAEGTDVSVEAPTATDEGAADAAQDTQMTVDELIEESKDSEEATDTFEAVTTGSPDSTATPEGTSSRPKHASSEPAEPSSSNSNSEPRHLKRD